MDDMIHVRNTVNGKVGTVRRSLFEHPVFNPKGQVLKEIEPGGKPYISETYKPKTVEEFDLVHPVKVKTEDKPEFKAPKSETDEK